MRASLAIGVALAAGVTLSGTALAAAGGHAAMHYDRHFQRIGHLPVYENGSELDQETVAEIIASTAEGNTLAYTDSEREVLGLVDLRDPTAPRAIGTVALNGEPTSVAITADGRAMVAVDTSTSLTETSGELVVVDVSEPSAPAVLRTLPLEGQPDSVAISPDGRYTAVAIENERDEELCVGGAGNGAAVPEDDAAAAARCREQGGVVGGLPQTAFGNPAGHLAIVDNRDYGLRRVDLTGLADYAPGDPEPEYVAINARGQAVVSLQENNHLVLVDLAAGTVVADFPAGRASVDQVDVHSDGRIRLTGTTGPMPREPDSVTWVDRGPGHMALIATANEGDLFGGTRSFSLFRPDGELVFDSGAALEHAAVRHGHFPEGRAGSKGTEPEAVTAARFGDDEYLFVASERGGFVAVYELWGHWPRLRQLLPAPYGPESVVAIPGRDLLVVSGEEDDPPRGVRATVNIYRLAPGAPAYPQIVAANGPEGLPLPWTALSGLADDPGASGRQLAVSDAAGANARLLHIDARERPAVITRSVAVTGGRGDLDAEGIAAAPDGTLWLASEGGAPGERRNRLLQIDPNGRVLREIGLPAAVEACREASPHTASLDNGFEGVTVLPAGSGYDLLVAQQLPWRYAGDDCAARGDRPGVTRLWRYAPGEARWSHLSYELEPTPEGASWVGLSEVVRAPDGALLLIERDNRTGAFATLKHVVRIPPSALADGHIARSEKQRLDLIPALAAGGGWISDKPEGLAVAADGNLTVVTDNDGVDGWSGETAYLRLGRYRERFELAR